MYMENAHRSPKLSIPQQIQDMRKRGISFDLFSEIEARKFLEKNNYYFKLKAYAHNFDRYKDPAKEGKYIHLDFAHLKDLSTIDAEFRKHILGMCIDLEHFLKVRMLHHFNMVDEDGYEIIDELFRRNPGMQEEIESKVNTSTCHSIVKKHRDNWAIWNVIELMSFGQFINLYNLFYERNHFPEDGCNLLFSVKMIRNAAAHNNCLLNQMRGPYSRAIVPTYHLKNDIVKLSSSKKSVVEKHLSHPTVHDFMALLFLYNNIVPDPTRTKGMTAIRDFFGERIPRHKEYYAKEQALVAVYSFTNEIVCRLTNSD